MDSPLAAADLTALPHAAPPSTRLASQAVGKTRTISAPLSSIGTVAS